MATITDIQPQKKRAGYYNIFVDESFFCSLSELQLASRALRVGQQLESVELGNLKVDSQIQKTYNRAIYYLKYGPRTVEQMRKYLLLKEYEPEYIELALERLAKERYLDDDKYIDNWIEQRRSIKARSSKQLYIELIKKGVDKQLVQSKLAELDDDADRQAIAVLIEKKGRLSQYQDRQKMTQYLMRQGFKYHDICSVLDE